MRRLSLLLLCMTLACACSGEGSVSSTEIAQRQSALGSTRAAEHVTLPTGIDLAYSEQGSPRGKPVIFLHGFTGSHRHFDLNLPLLSRRFHAFALDLRGHGDSSKPACCYTQDDLAADVIGFMDALSLPRASLVGHSMGSLIAHKIAVDHPDRVDRLVLISSAPTTSGNPTNDGVKALINSLADPIDPEFVRGFEASIFFGSVPDSFLDTITAETVKMPAAIWKAVFEGLIAEDHSSALSTISAKTLIMWGDEDTVFSPADQAQLDSLIRRSKLIVYEGAGHGLHAEMPRRTVRDITHFLRRRFARR